MSTLSSLALKLVSEYNDNQGEKILMKKKNLKTLN